MGGRKVDLEAAKELYDFICKNVELPDVLPNPADGLVEFAKGYIEKLTKDKGVDLWTLIRLSATHLPTSVGLHLTVRRNAYHSAEQ